MNQELKDFSDSIIQQFPVDILRRNKMVDMIQQEDRELLYFDHMYRPQQQLLNQPHHFQSDLFITLGMEQGGLKYFFCSQIVHMYRPQQPLLLLRQGQFWSVWVNIGPSESISVRWYWSVGVGIGLLELVCRG